MTIELAGQIGKALVAHPQNGEFMTEAGQGEWMVHPYLYLYHQLYGRNHPQLRASRRVIVSIYIGGRTVAWNNLVYGSQSRCGQDVDRTWTGRGRVVGRTCPGRGQCAVAGVAGWWRSGGEMLTRLSDFPAQRTTPGAATSQPNPAKRVLAGLARSTLTGQTPTSQCLLKGRGL